ncbi:hypothetical protein BASA83_002371 [Batrachochytrium salamandrivorans]|nr:hypothetical protein BASA83_002371 [Batrachochytrium salamandrivorans]
MCSLLGSGHPAVLARIDAVLGMLTGIMSQFHNMSSDEAATFAYKVRDEDDDEHSLDDARQDLLMSLDPVFKNDSLSYSLRTNLASLEQKLGGQQQLQHLLSMADPDLLIQLQHFTK